MEFIQSMPKIVSLFVICKLLQIDFCFQYDYIKEFITKISSEQLSKKFT